MDSTVIFLGKNTLTFNKTLIFFEFYGKVIVECMMMEQPEKEQQYLMRTVGNPQIS